MIMEVNNNISNHTLLNQIIVNQNNDTILKDTIIPLPELILGTITYLVSFIFYFPSSYIKLYQINKKKIFLINIYIIIVYAIFFIGNHRNDCRWQYSCCSGCLYLSST